MTKNVENLLERRSSPENVEKIRYFINDKKRRKLCSGVVHCLKTPKKVDILSMTKKRRKRA
jgi:hypothetical protein